MSNLINWEHLSLIAILIIECYFFSFGNVSDSEEANTNDSINRPFLCFAIWVTRMIYESTANRIASNWAFLIIPPLRTGSILFFWNPLLYKTFHNPRSESIQSNNLGHALTYGWLRGKIGCVFERDQQLSRRKTRVIFD